MVFVQCPRVLNERGDSGFDASSSADGSRLPQVGPASEKWGYVTPGFGVRPAASRVHLVPASDTAFNSLTLRTL